MSTISLWDTIDDIFQAFSRFPAPPTGANFRAKGYAYMKVYRGIYHLSNSGAVQHGGYMIIPWNPVEIPQAKNGVKHLFGIYQWDQNPAVNINFEFCMRLKLALALHFTFELHNSLQPNDASDPHAKAKLFMTNYHSCNYAPETMAGIASELARIKIHKTGRILKWIPSFLYFHAMQTSHISLDFAEDWAMCHVRRYNNLLDMVIHWGEVIRVRKLMIGSTEDKERT